VATGESEIRQSKFETNPNGEKSGNGWGGGCFRFPAFTSFELDSDLPRLRPRLSLCARLGLRISNLLPLVLAPFLAIPSPAEELPVDFKWRVLLEPKSMRREVTWEIPGAQRTVIAPVVVDGIDYLYPSRKILGQFRVEAGAIQELAAPAAAADLATLKPRYERDRKQVIQYAELRSDRPIVASAVLAPKFLKLFKDTLGEKVLLVVPNRFTAYVFPVLASNYQDYYPMVFDAYRATAWPVSVEVFEVSTGGLRAVGVYREP